MSVTDFITPNGEKRYAVVDATGDMVEPIMRFLKFVDNGQMARNTLKAYAYDLSTLWKYLEIRSITFKEINDLDSLAAYIRWLQYPTSSEQQEPYSLQERQRSPRSINRALSTIIKFYDFFWRRGEIETNFVDITAIDLPPKVRQFRPLLHHLIRDTPVKRNILALSTPRQRPKTLTSEQITLLVNSCSNSRDRLLISLLFRSSIRIGEALALWIEDIWYDKRMIEVRDRGYLVNEAEIKSPCSNRKIDLCGRMIDELSSYLATEYPSDASSNHLFLKLRGKRAKSPMSYPEAYDIFVRLKHKTGIDAWPHILRHSSLTDLARQGVRPEILKERAGHSHYFTTFQLYVHTNDEDLSSALRTVLEKQEI